MITRIIDETGVKIDIDDDGRVYVFSNETKACKKALAMIEGISKDVEPGQYF